MATAINAGMISTPGPGETRGGGSSEADGDAGGVLAPGGSVGFAAELEDADADADAVPVGGVEVSVGGVEVSVGGAVVSVGGVEVSVGGVEVSVGGAVVSVGGAVVSVGGAEVSVGGGDVSDVWDGEGDSVGSGGTNSTSHAASQMAMPSVSQFSPG